MKSVLDEISDIISWYQNQYSGAPIEQLMDAKSKLLTLAYRYAGEVADAKQGAIEAANTRKADFFTFKHRLIQEGHSGVESESRAEVAVKAQRKHEAESEALFFKSKQLLDIAIKVSEDITQRISILKKERENG